MGNAVLLASALTFATLVPALQAVGAPKVHMLHQWATGSDAAAIAKLGEMFEAAGGEWQQTAVPGQTANTLAKLRAEVIAGTAPAAVQLKGPEIGEWNQTGGLANLDRLAAREGWDEVVAPELLPVMKPTGTWVAAPMNIHRVNWLWASKRVLDKAHISELPKTWAELDAACDKIIAAGIVPCIGHFSRDWSDATVFETVLYGTDLDTFRLAFVDGNTDAMRSPHMVDAFARMRTLVSKYMDPGIAGRPYSDVTNMIGNGTAAFLITGDWQVGIFHAAGFEYGTDYLCGQAPTDWGKPGFILNSDSVVFFRQTDPDQADGQELLAHLIMSEDFQRIFNQTKGSIPARLDVDLSEGFSPCQQLSQEDLRASVGAGTLVRSLAHNMTVLQRYRGAAMEVITEFVNDPSVTPEDAANAMADAVEGQD